MITGSTRLYSIIGDPIEHVRTALACELAHAVGKKALLGRAEHERAADAQFVQFIREALDRSRAEDDAAGPAGIGEGNHGH